MLGARWLSAPGGGGSPELAATGGVGAAGPASLVFSRCESAIGMTVTPIPPRGPVPGRSPGGGEAAGAATGGGGGAVLFLAGASGAMAPRAGGGVDGLLPSAPPFPFPRSFFPSPLFLPSFPSPFPWPAAGAVPLTAPKLAPSFLFPRPAAGAVPLMAPKLAPSFPFPFPLPPFFAPSFLAPPFFFPSSTAVPFPAMPPFCDCLPFLPSFCPPFRLPSLTPFCRSILGVAPLRCPAALPKSPRICPTRSPGAIF